MKRKRAGQGIALALSAALLLSGCTGVKTTTAGGDAITQKATAPGRTQLTITCKFGVAYSNLEAAIEEAMPELDLVQVGNFTYDSNVEAAKRFAADDWTDIVAVATPDAGAEYHAQRLMDLSAQPFTACYNITALNSLKRDGRLYLLPAPMQIRSLLYNKTLLAELGCAVPTDFDSFVALCDTATKANVRPVHLALCDGMMRQYAFNGFGYDPCLSTPADDQWQQEYNSAHKGGFYDHMRPAFDHMQVLLDHGIIRPGDVADNAADRVQWMTERECLMTEDGPALVRILQDADTTDEFGLMPYWSGGAGSDWVVATGVIYFGLNKHLEEPQNKEREQLALAALEFISSPAGQAALLADNIGVMSAVKDVPLADAPGLSDLSGTLEKGHYGAFNCVKPSVLPELTALLGQYIEGKATAVQVGAGVDEANRAEAVEVVLPVLGTAAADFSLMETGNFIADAMRAQSGSQLALFPDLGKDSVHNYIGVSAKFYKGDLTAEDVARVLPIMKPDAKNVLCNVTMSGEAVVKALEYASGPKDWFYYFSGIRVEFDPCAPQGSRVKKITNPDGSAFDRAETYTVAIMADTVEQDCLSSAADTDRTISDVVTAAIERAKTIAPSGDGRLCLISE